MRNQRLIRCCIMIAGMGLAVSGCKWDDSLYETYVSEKHEISACPPGTLHTVNGVTYIDVGKMQCFENQVRIKSNKDILLQDTGDLDCASCSCALSDGIMYCSISQDCNTQCITSEFRRSYSYCRWFSLYSKQRGLYDTANPVMPMPGFVSHVMEYDSNNKVMNNLIENYPDAKENRICPSDYNTCVFNDDIDSTVLNSNDDTYIFGCIRECKDNLVMCDDKCIDPKTDNDHCGASDSCSIENNTYGMKCMNGYQCIEGVCQCPQEDMDACNGKCVFRSSYNYDNENCGSCGAKCKDKGKSMVCYYGDCRESPCETDQNQCYFKGQCINETKHCGENCIDCVSEGEFAKQADCIAEGDNPGTCVTTECLEGFHLYYDDNHVPKCAKNTPESCGDTKSGTVQNCKELNEHSEDIVCNDDGTCTIMTCEPGYHLNNDQNKCVENTDNQCGSDDNQCSTDMFNNSKSVICDTDNGVCKLESCNPGYHTYNGQCEANTIDNCGTHGNICKTADFTGSTDITCTVEGKCVATACTVSNSLMNIVTGKTGYHIYDGKCEENSEDNCGSHDKRCTTSDVPGSSKVLCIPQVGMCLPALCNTNFHGYVSESSITCEADNLNNCGAHDYVCNASNVPNGTAFGCSNGKCIATQCASGTHLYDNQCEANSNTNCGAHNTKCTAGTGESGKTCNTATGKCIATGCNSGYHYYDGGCEANSDTHCGANGRACKAGTGENTRTCSTDGVCTFNGCTSGYHSYGTGCEKNDNTNCGAHNRACKAGTGEAARSCSTDGVCAFNGCTSGYHSYGTGCEQNDNTNCGAHDRACKAGTGEAARSCSTDGLCPFAGCASTYHLYGSGCEANSDSHCGSHGNACASNKTCNKSTGKCG